ncbi:MAG: fatty acid--CoA ligase [Clostridia bacterium]|nr:fatty acid--CoA ligase [Clostridia bacterium]
MPQTPLRALDRAVSLFPGKRAVWCEGRTWTYADFFGRVQQLSRALAALGVGPGDRVAYLSYNCHRLLEGYFAVPQMGAILLPLNIRLLAQDFRVILRHSGARLLFVHPDFLETVEAIRPDLPELEHVLLLEPDPRGRAEGPTYDQLLEAQPRDPYPRPEVDEDDVAELFYTSGTTGQPKGVMLTHRNLYALALQMVGALQFDEPDVHLHSLPMYHANGWGAPQTVTLVGGTHVMLPRFQAAQAVERIEALGVTTAYMVPTMVIELLNLPGLESRDLRSMRRLVVGGAAPSPTMAREVTERLGWPFVAAYGLTESSPVATFAFLRSWQRGEEPEQRYRRMASTGQPMPGVEARVVDLAGRDVPLDGRTPGELLLRGDTVMKGYWNNPEATAEAIRDGWLHTGDVATMDADRFIQIVDRKKDIIISGGENISSIEVEDTLYAHPAVMECAVIAVPDAKWGERPLALVVPKPGAAADRAALAEELRLWCRDRLAHFKAPDRVEIVDSLPKTGTGKIQKNVLREMYREAAPSDRAG